MAPVGALGTMALAESTEDRKSGWKWRVFSIGGVIGLAFGFFYVLLPALSGLLFSEPIRLIPIPWIELTQHTEDILPAVATGLQFDLGLVFIGMVLPFWAVIGGLVGLIITIVGNPILYAHGVLHRWHPGMATVETVFANNFDFYMSFGIGLGLAIGAVGVYYVIKSFRNTDGSGLDFSALFNPPEGRGDINFWVSIGIYVFSTLCYIAFCVWLVPSFPWIFFVLYGFIYTPVISYITARMEGVAGQFIALPMVREFSFIAGAKFFGYQGLEIWYAPIPIHNYGEATVQFRQIELTGTSLRGIIKAEIIVFPIVMISSLLFPSSSGSSRRFRRLNIPLRRNSGICRRSIRCSCRLRHLKEIRFSSKRSPGRSCFPASASDSACTRYSTCLGCLCSLSTVWCAVSGSPRRTA